MPEPPGTLVGVRVHWVWSLVRATVPVNPPSEAIVIVDVPGVLTEAGTVVGFALMVKSGGEVTVTEIVPVELVIPLFAPPTPLIIRE